MVAKRRHMMKAVSWRIVGTLDTTLLAWFITGSIELGAMIGGIEVITKTILYYFHERVWYNHIKFGIKD
jgi:uncharacterized membrane protein